MCCLYFVLMLLIQLAALTVTRSPWPPFSSLNFRPIGLSTSTVISLPALAACLLRLVMHLLERACRVAVLPKKVC